ncbi:hypothetical protein ABZ478_38215 [Streptomyces sp. NPDC005706]|uniref:hypothetical protein n=1 Tax=Streptomyces sp. NPDC005706 TaxID=3157169 RepID=UPI0033D80C49
MARTEVVREYRRRRESPGQGVRFTLPAVLALYYVAQSMQKDVSWVRWFSLALLLVTTGALTWGLLRLRRGFTRVDVNGVVIHGAIRCRRIPWSGIDDLGVRRAPQSGRAEAFVDTMDGRRRSLPQLNEWQVEGLHTEVAALREIGSRYGARTWESTPGDEQPFRRREGSISRNGAVVVTPMSAESAGE